MTRGWGAKLPDPSRPPSAREWLLLAGITLSNLAALVMWLVMWRRGGLPTVNLLGLGGSITGVLIWCWLLTLRRARAARAAARAALPAPPSPPTHLDPP